MARSPLRDGSEGSESDGGGVKKGPWTPEEDQKLVEYVEKHGRGSWQRIPKLAGLNRCGKSCRLRWTNYLRPDIKRGKFTEEEEQRIIHLHSLLGNKWSSIATKLPGRTDNEIKNYWNTHLRKKLLRMGIDPVTHRPTAATTNLGLLAGLSTLLAPGNAAAVDSALKLVQADVAHLLKLQLVQNLFQVLTTTTTTPPSTPTSTSASSSSAATAAVDLVSLLGSAAAVGGGLQGPLPAGSNLALLSQLLSGAAAGGSGGLLQPLRQPVLMESSLSAEEEAEYASRTTTEEAASMEISNGGSAASISTPTLISPNSSDSIRARNNVDLLKSTNTNNNSIIFADNNNNNHNHNHNHNNNLAASSSSSYDAWDNLKLDNLDTDFGWKEIIEEMTWPEV